MRKCYSELIRYSDYDSRLDYLFIGGQIGVATFGNDRYLNQVFYRSYEWQKVRRQIIIRDNGNDLGIDGLPIDRKIYIHHMNAITIEDILNRDSSIFDPENLICCSYDTHRAIHYGIREPYHERNQYDSCPWKMAERR